jgi:ATP-binding cassette subfamily F protein 3
MFGGEASDKKVKVLSGGEKTRLAMIRLLLEPVNLLILDEPTNHLDMKTKDILKQAIKDFNGTVIVVSHDREFLDGLVEKVYEFGGGKVRECLGGIYEFLEKKKIENLSQLELTKSPTQTAPVCQDKEQQGLNDARKMSYAEQREREKILKRAVKKAEEAEEEVSRIEQLVKDIEDKISAGDVTASIFEEHSEANKKLENAMSVWELAVMEVEELKSKS